MCVCTKPLLFDYGCNVPFPQALARVTSPRWHKTPWKCKPKWALPLQTVYFRVFYPSNGKPNQDSSWPAPHLGPPSHNSSTAQAWYSLPGSWQQILQAFLSCSGTHNLQFSQFLDDKTGNTCLPWSYPELAPEAGDNSSNFLKEWMSLPLQVTSGTGFASHHTNRSMGQRELQVHSQDTIFTPCRVKRRRKSQKN